MICWHKILSWYVVVVCRQYMMSRNVVVTCCLKMLSWNAAWNQRSNDAQHDVSDIGANLVPVDVNGEERSKVHYMKAICDGMFVTWSRDPQTMHTMENAVVQLVSEDHHPTEKQPYSLNNMIHVVISEMSTHCFTRHCGAKINTLSTAKVVWRRGIVLPPMSGNWPEDKVTERSCSIKGKHIKAGNWPKSPAPLHRHIDNGVKKQSSIYHDFCFTDINRRQSQGQWYYVTVFSIDFQSVRSVLTKTTNRAFPPDPGSEQVDEAGCRSNVGSGARPCHALCLSLHFRSTFAHSEDYRRHTKEGERHNGHKSDHAPKMGVTRAI